MFSVLSFFKKLYDSKENIKSKDAYQLTFA